MSDPENGDCIKIFVRVRPSFTEQKLCLNVTSEQQIVLLSQSNPKVFEFDHVADQSTTQDRVFANVGKQIVESCVEGYNGTIFAYGQTGSGKTYTMLGPGEDGAGNFDHHLRGIIPRSLEYLFELIQRKQEMHGKQFDFTCKASFLEIYNEQIFDLLDPSGTGPLQLRECRNRGVFVEGTLEKSVASGFEAYNVLSEGWCNRRVASTSMNRESSRSHAVFTLTVETREQTASITKVRQAVLNLVDLAGSERQKDTLASGIQLREAGKINGSLSILGQVIMALDDRAHQKTRHVPYRNSKLTFLLRDSLGGNAKTYIIVNVHPNAQYFGETTSTLQFAQRAKQIKNRAIVNENTQGDFIQLQAEVKRLKEIIKRFEDSGMKRTFQSVSNEVENSMSQGYYEVRKKFLLAMQMLRKQDKVTVALKRQFTKMEKFNLSRNFVIKLRDSTIADLKRGKTRTRDETIESLEKELQAVKDQVLHHPEIGGYQTKLQELQNEIEELGQTTISEAQEKDLDELYIHLFNEVETEKISPRSDSVFSPTDTSLLSPAINEEQKSRIAELEHNLKLKDDEVAALKTQNSTLGAELKTTKAQVEDLEMILQTTQADSSLQQRRLNEMHKSTLRSITTPKRRQRGSSAGFASPAKISRVDPVPFGLFQSPNGDLEDDLSHIPMLMDQKMPADMEDVIHEALQEELEQVKEEMERYREKGLANNCELASIRQSEATLKEQINSYSQCLAQAKDQVYNLESVSINHKTNHEIAQLEVRDLRILLNAADKEFAEARQDFKATQSTLNKKIEDLKANYFHLQVAQSKLEAEKESVVNQAHTLGVDVENQRMELEFVKEQLAEEIKSIESERNKNECLQKEFKAAREMLESEMANCATLQEQLDGKSKSTSEALSILRTSNYDLAKKLTVAQEENNSMNEKFINLNKELENNQKRRQEDGAANQALRNQVSELRGSYSMLEIANTGLHAEIDEIMEEISKSAVDLEAERGLREILGKKLAEEQNEFKVKLSKHDFEMESLQEDLICWNEQYCNLNAELKVTKTELETSRKKCDVLQHEVREKCEKLNDQRTLLQKAEDAESQVKEAERRNTDLIEKHKNDMDLLQSKIEKDAKITDSVIFREQQATDNFLKLSEQLTAIQSELKEATQHKAHLEEENKKMAEEKEGLMTENATLAGHTNHRQKIHYLTKLKEKITSLEEENSKLSLELQNVISSLKKHEPGFKAKRSSFYLSLPECGHSLPLSPRNNNK